MNKLFATYLGRTWTELAEEKRTEKKKKRAALIGMHAPPGNSRLGALGKKKIYRLVPETRRWMYTASEDRLNYSMSGGCKWILQEIFIAFSDLLTESNSESFNLLNLCLL